jgi:hypothetical protein
MRILPGRLARGVLALGALLTTSSAFAADTPSFTNVSNSDFEGIVKELSANFGYSTITSASSLGGLWGFELGLTGGITKTPFIADLVKRNDPNFKQDKFPHAAALLRIGAPKGLTAEVMIFPKVSASDLSISQYGGSVMWTVTDVFWTQLPVTLAVKGYYSKFSLGFKQTINNSTTGNQPVDAAINFDNSSLGAQILASRKFSVFTPYVGLGFAKASGELGITAATAPNASFFASQAQSAAAKPSSIQLMAGLDIKLFFLALGGEFQRSYGTNSLTGRLSFRF